MWKMAKQRRKTRPVENGRHYDCIPFSDCKLTDEECIERMTRATSQELTRLFSSKEFEQWVLKRNRASTVKAIMIGAIIASIIWTFAFFSPIMQPTSPCVSVCQSLHKMSEKEKSIVETGTEIGPDVVANYTEMSGNGHLHEVNAVTGNLTGLLSDNLETVDSTGESNEVECEWKAKERCNACFANELSELQMLETKLRAQQKELNDYRGVFVAIGLYAVCSVFWQYMKPKLARLIVGMV